MLEKEKKVRGKKMYVLLMAMVMCIGMCVSAYAGVRTGSVMGLDYIFVGTYNNKTLQGATGCDNIAENLSSYVSVEFRYKNVTIYQDLTYGKYGTEAYLCQPIGETSSNWRVYNSMTSKKTSSSISVSAGGYSFY